MSGGTFWGDATLPGVGGTHWGFGSLGTPGALIPSDGDHGASYLFNDLTLPADAAVEVYGAIETWPVGLTSFVAAEDGSITATGEDGVYPFVYRLFADLDDRGTAPGTITIGSPASATLSGGVTLDDVVAAGGLASAPSLLHGSITLADVVASGAIIGQPSGGGTMSMLDLIADLKASLQDAAKVFTAADDADFRRHITRAADAFASKRPRTVLTSATLQADVSEYDVPADFLSFKMHLWGVQPRVRPKPWERGWPGALPRVHYTEVAAGSYKLSLEPSPSDAQLAALGSDFRYYYFARHVVHETDGAQTTILPGERGLLLLRAQAEACRELALRGMTKPVQLRDGMSQAPRNSTPAALYAAFLKEFQETAL